MDRPIGTWLLLWPCWWALLAAGGDIYYFFLFAIGAWLMRGAGCTYNDLIDQPFDMQVARTKTRPLAAGSVSRVGAVMFLLLQAALAALVLIEFNALTITFGIASLVLVAIYPFMKRITYWPQFFLGLTFSWGALMGWTAVVVGVPLSAWLLYLGSIFWVIGYDTIYALQDKEDDAMLGLKSTALVLTDNLKLWLVLFYGVAWIFITLSGFVLHAQIGFYSAMAMVAVHFAWQIKTLAPENASSALRLFKSNRDCGALIAAAFAVHQLTDYLSR